MAPTISEKAFSKCILHVAKYPYCAVNGVFLADRKKYKDIKEIAIIECIPLFHQCVGLAPMLEIALLQIDTHCEANGLIIAGYYHANEHIKDNSPSPIALKIAEKIQENFNDSTFFLVNNERVDDTCRKDSLVAYQSSDGKWKQASDQGFKLEGDASDSEACAQLLKNRAQDELVDFDCHLDDITKDWQNQTLNDLIESYTG